MPKTTAKILTTPCPALAAQRQCQLKTCGRAFTVDLSDPAQRSRKYCCGQHSHEARLIKQSGEELPTERVCANEGCGRKFAPKTRRTRTCPHCQLALFQSILDNGKTKDKRLVKLYRGQVARCKRLISEDKTRS